jgi:hypothetical protein
VRQLANAGLHLLCQRWSTNELIKHGPLLEHANYSSIKAGASRTSLFRLHEGPAKH